MGPRAALRTKHQSPQATAAEAAGLRWLRAADAVPIPEIVAELPEMLALEWVDSGEPSREAAERFGRELAQLHRAGAPAFGAEWPGFFGSLPMDNTPSDGPWSSWFAVSRLEPYLKLSADRGSLSAPDVRAVSAVLANLARYGGDEPPARLHGDLWQGNLLWGPGRRVWLVDPAAHGGHRETDLAFLAAFGGAPFLDRIVESYEEVWPLSEGWRERVPLHQLSLLLVHTALFGGAYRSSVMTAVGALS